MSLFYPDVYFPHITDIPGSFFVKRQIRLIILDVDNTLTSHNNPVPFPGVQEWIEARKKEGLTLVICPIIRINGCVRLLKRRAISELRMRRNR